uniref:Uncharacterized protein n=1 Tax=Pristionchus pacificus TaxID=54126 RepID=A0A2A6C1F3_PRIPA|eukprot:PDM72082.1 hypothetical protein PRIPAC_38489 [Pristionchus pacificus]
MELTNVNPSFWNIISSSSITALDDMAKMGKPKEGSESALYVGQNLNNNVQCKARVKDMIRSKQQEARCDLAMESGGKKAKTSCAREYEDKAEPND